jgi:hypothetical protein
MRAEPGSPEFERQFRARYEALYPEIDRRRLPGERNWLDRVASWEDFVEFGATAAETLRGPLGEDALYPELAALVLEAFER